MEEVRIACDGSEYKALSELSNFQGKLKRLQKEKYEVLKKEILERGFSYPFFVWRGKIFDGHQRFETLKRMQKDKIKMPEKFPVVNIQAKDEKELAEKLIAYNSIIGEITPSGLIDFMKDYNLDFDFVSSYDLGLDMPLVSKLMDSKEKTEEEKDFTAEADKIKEPISKKGKTYLLGVHKLVCGDSTDSELISNLMKDKFCDMVFTDPPYLMTMCGKSGVFGNDMTKTTERVKDIVDFKPEKFLSTLPSYFNKTMNAFIFCSKELVPKYLNYAVDNKYNFNILTWCKKSICPLSGGHHYSDIEYIIYFSKKPIFHNGVPGASYRKYFIFDREKEHDELHPTVKPQEIIQNEIKICSNVNGIVVDPFLGSGSTIIACEVTKRKCYGFEIDERYCDVIRKRWSEFVHGKDCDWEKLTPEEVK